jgi:drug/metabolite transporter (DMT)-like permease
MKAKYVLIVALGAMSFGMLSSFAKIAYTQGYSPAEVTFAQAFLGAVVLWSWVFLKWIRTRKVNLKSARTLLLAGTCIGLSAYTYYLSVAYIPASLAIVLLMQITWMGLFLEWAVNKNKPSVYEILAVVFILGGTVMASGLTDISASHISLTGVVLALASSVVYSLYILFTAKLGKDVPMQEKSALMISGSATTIFLMNMKSLVSSVHFDLGLLLWGLFLAVFGTVIPPVCFSVGMPKIGTGLSSILLTLELPVAVFCANFILNEELTIFQIFGIVIMLVAIILLNLVKARKKVATPDIAEVEHI